MPGKIVKSHKELFSLDIHNEIQNDINTLSLMKSEREGCQSFVCSSVKERNECPLIYKKKAHMAGSSGCSSTDSSSCIRK